MLKKSMLSKKSYELSEDDINLLNEYGFYDEDLERLTASQVRKLINCYSAFKEATERQVELGNNKHRTIDILSLDSVIGLNLSDFEDFPIYELLGNGVIKENAGIMRKNDAKLVYDVTKASEGFKNEYRDLIEHNFEVKETVKLFPTKPLKSPDEKGRVHMIDIMPVDVVDVVIGATPRSFSQYTIYEVLGNGVIRENAGIKRDRDTVLVYDVTRASEDFKQRYGNVIRRDFEVTQLIREKETKLSVPKGKIISILPLGNAYAKLNKDEKLSLGNDFVTVRALTEGVEVKPLIRTKEIPGNLFVKVDTSLMKPELSDKISSEVVELNEMANGLYDFNLVTLMPLDGIYGTLERQEMDALGYNYVTVSNTAEGISLNSLNSTTLVQNNTYLKVYPFLCSSSLRSKVSGELVELRKKENGLYERNGSFQQGKKMN